MPHGPSMPARTITAVSQTSTGTPAHPGMPLAEYLAGR
jgi:hypothetical protein